MTSVIASLDFRPRAVLALLSVLAMAACGGGPAKSGGGGPGGRSLVLITVDTLRADHVGCYGATAPATPGMDRLARSGTLFADVEAVMPITLPAHASIMTGRYPVAHGARHNVAYVLPEEEKTLAEVLREKGFRTGGFVGAFPVTARFGMAQGFEVFDEAFTSSGALKAAKGDVERPAGEVDRAAIPWLQRTAASGEPFFLWIHYFDPHAPYEPPEHLARLYEQSPYSGEVAAVDEAVATLLDALEKTGAADRTAVVLVSDHGEALGDHGEATHGYFLYQTTTHVPMMMRIPWMTGSPKQVEQVVSQVDILPTALDLLGVPPPEGVQGRSLKPLLEGGSLPDRPVLGDCIAPWVEFRFSPLRSVRDGRWKYIEAPKPELYDETADPKEVRNLVSGEPAEATRLRDLLHAELARARQGTRKATATRAISEEERQKLASLGYTAGGGQPAADSVPEPSASLTDPKDGLPLVSRFDAAYLEFSRGEYGACAESFRSLRKDLPESPVVQENLGQCLLLSGNAAEAKDVLAGLVKIEPNYAAARVRYGQSLEVLGENDAALAQYRAAAEMSTGFPEARMLLGMLLFRTGKPDEGVAEARLGVKGAPDSIPYRRTLAQLLEQTGKPKEAVEVMAEFTRLRPDDPRSWIELGGMCVRHRDLPGAEGAFGKAAALAPDNAVARTNLGSLMLIKKEYAKAEENFRAAISAAPGMPDPQLSLARAILFQKREEEGKNLLDACAVRFPRDSRAHSYWGLYLQQVTEDPQGARNAYREALKVNPRDPIALEGLAALEGGTGGGPPK